MILVFIIWHDIKFKLIFIAGLFLNQQCCKGIKILLNHNKSKVLPNSSIR